MRYSLEQKILDLLGVKDTRVTRAVIRMQVDHYIEIELTRIADVPPDPDTGDIEREIKRYRLTEIEEPTE
jgi:L-fucose mutarotase/ribose pyranase (RbsD/FucU family)